jgi:prepilin signal peptidase PulO-like enzyme (type II secretory pathway)
MTELTGLVAFEWVLLAVVSFATWLAVRSASRSIQGRRLAGLLVVPLAIGIALFAVLLAVYSVALLSLPVALFGRPIAILVAIGVLVLTWVLTDWLFLRAVPIARSLIGRVARTGGTRSSDAALALVLIGAAAIAVGATWSLRHTARDAQFDRQAFDALNPAPTPRAEPDAPPRLFDVPGRAMSLVMATEVSGYVSLDEGQIVRFTLPESEQGDVALQVVADGFEHLRGIAIRGGELFVVELGPLPCPPEVWLCRGSSVGAATLKEGELLLLSRVRASIHALPIQPDGSLGEPRLVVGNLPVVGGDHAVNGMARGPDDRLYVSVGNVESPDMPDLSDVTPNPEWIGTVLTFDGSGEAPTIFARGLRNVYGLAFDAQGRLWGVDNDGPTANGWRLEEVLQIKQGRHYGHPIDGTFGPASLRDDGPVWLMPHVGSAGIAVAEEAGLGEGLLVGRCGAVIRLAPVAGEGPWEERLGPGSVTELLPVQGCVTGIVGLGGGRFVASVFRGNRDGALMLARVSEASP